MPKLWKVSRVEFTRDAKFYGPHKVQYPLHVEGVNTETGDAFSWQVPDVYDTERYDLASAAMSESVRAFIYEGKAP